MSENQFFYNAIKQWNALPAELKLPLPPDTFYPLLPSVLNIGRLTKILISIKEGIIKKNSYERRAYESVDD